MIYYNGIFHSMLSENDTFYGMDVENGIIKKIYKLEKDLENKSGVDLGGKHVYPCLIDGHTHLMSTIATYAMGFNACEITANGVEPNTIKGVERRIREYCAKQKKDAVIASTNYILTAVDERRMPTKDELDDWAGGRAIVIYNIDGHSTSLSTKMLKLIGIDPKGHSGVLQGEDNERAQGRILDAVSKTIGIGTLAKGVGELHNRCASYGVSVVAALEGNGDSVKDNTTNILVKIARHFDLDVRLYLQYTDFDRVKSFEKYMKHKRVGGCGDWEMDGATGSHSSAFRVPFKDTGKTAPCYYTQEYVDEIVKKFNDAGYQIASHAIGELAIDRIIDAYNKLDTKKLHRIEHCEFHDDEAFKELAKGRYAVMMQPGYAWIDKRYLHTYEQFLPDVIIKRLKFKSLYDAGIILCGSSDSPVQDIDPYLQMLGMVQFYRDEESISPYQALCTYTVNAAKAIEEYNERGSLEEGKIADFFVSDRNFFELNPEELVSFRPLQTYYKGKPYQKKQGSLGELAKMMLRKAKLI